MSNEWMLHSSFTSSLESFLCRLGMSDIRMKYVHIYSEYSENDFKSNYHFRVIGN